MRITLNGTIKYCSDIASQVLNSVLIVFNSWLLYNLHLPVCEIGLPFPA